MHSTSSAYLATTLGPAGSSSATMVQTMAVLVVVLAALVILCALPQSRAAVKRFRSDVREYMYGPQKRKKKRDQTSAAVAEEPEASGDVGSAETRSFDYSIYNEDPDDEK